MTGGFLTSSLGRIAIVKKARLLSQRDRQSELMGWVSLNPGSLGCGIRTGGAGPWLPFAWASPAPYWSCWVTWELRVLGCGWWSGDGPRALASANPFLSFCQLLPMKTFHSFSRSTTSKVTAPRVGVKGAPIPGHGIQVLA